MDVAKAAPAISAFFMVMRFQKRSGSRISSCRHRTSGANQQIVGRILTTSAARSEPTQCIGRTAAALIRTQRSQVLEFQPCVM